MTRERSQAWNDGYEAGRLGYDKDYQEYLRYNDRPSIVQYLNGYSLGIEAYLLEED